MNRSFLKAIAKQKLKNFICGGGFNMDYRMTEQFNKNAESVVEKSMLDEKVKKLKNTISNLKISDDVQKIACTCFDDGESENILSLKQNYLDEKNRLEAKLETLDVCKNDYLKNFDINNASKITDEINCVKNVLNSIDVESSLIDSKVESSKNEYFKQMEDINAEMGEFKFENASPNFNEKYSKNVVNDFKISKAKKYVDNFLSNLSEEQRDVVLSENEDLKRYVENVGENI